MLKDFANDLKLRREKLKISLPEISAQTRINEVFLRNLENGDFSFQQEIYIRAFIKEYANALELDPAEVIKDYDLAKRGEYKSKFATEEKKEPEKEKKEDKADEKKSVAEKETKSEDKKETKKEVKKEDKKETEEKEVQKETEEPPVEKSNRKKRVRITPDKPPEPDPKTTSKEIKPETEPVPPSVKKLKSIDNGGDKVQPSVLKGIGLFFLSVLILIGLYYMVKAVFLDDGNENGSEIVRQKFDDVVKENERKILGKRTEEEIRDSIRRAEEEQQRLIEQNLDTMVLKINSIKSGSVIVVEDSTNIENPEKISFTGNQYGEWKATRSFLITSPNTSAFTVELNGQKIDIKEKTVKNYLISRKDLTDTTKTGDQTNNK
ncbi:MAG: helix-turn-helix domain-containing protein [Ignavibacteriae bacterium]|nr:helix-turn-helix domain-containing protein [Ignavibacteriota bacterium]